MINYSSIIIIFVFALFSNVCNAEKHRPKDSDSPTVESPYFGQKPPGLIPEIFAPGIISINGRYQYGVHFSPDLDEIYYTAANKEGISSVYFSKIENEKWTNPEKANFTKGKIIDEFSGSVSPDGKRIYFSTYDSKFPLKIWYVNRFEASWSNAILLDSPINNDKVINLNLAKNGDLYYLNGGKMYYAPNKNGKFPEGHEVEIDYGSHGFISPSQDFLMLVAHKENDKAKDKDIHVSFKKKDGTWSKPINLGNPVASDFREEGPTITPDGKYLFFSRYNGKDGNPNIYWVSTKIIHKLKTAYFEN